MSSSQSHRGNQATNCFTIAASIVQYTPYLGPAVAMTLQAIGEVYQQSQDCRSICGALPDQLKHFSEKINRARSCGENALNPDEPWLRAYAEQFDALIQRIKADLDEYRERKLSAWFTASKYKGKFTKHVDDMAAINKNLDDAIQQVMLRCVRRVVDRLDSFGLPAGSPQPSAMPSQDAVLVRDALESTRLLMAEVDVNRDGHITVDELWNVQQLRDLVVDKESLQKLIAFVFDRNGDGRLDFEETITLTAALHQLSKLFYTIPHRCDDTNYITATTAVQALKRLGYNCVTDYDILEAAQMKPHFFRQCEATHELQASYEGLLAFYLHALDRHHLWAHARSRIGAA